MVSGMPIGIGRSRLLFRTYISGLPKFALFLFKLKPKFLRDLNSCKILEQDVGLITTQEDHFARNPERQLCDDFFMLKSSDLFVYEYRKWMDRVGLGMPWYQGLFTRSTNVSNHLSGTERPPALDAKHRASNEAVSETRYHRHVMLCPSSRSALAKVKVFKRVALTITALSIAMTSAFSPLLNRGCKSILAQILLRGFILAIPTSALVATGLHNLEKRFYFSFKRKNELRTESGL